MFIYIIIIKVCVYFRDISIVKEVTLGKYFYILNTIFLLNLSIKHSSKCGMDIRLIDTGPQPLKPFKIQPKAFKIQ